MRAELAPSVPLRVSKPASFETHIGDYAQIDWREVKVIVLPDTEQW